MGPFFPSYSKICLLDCCHSFQAGIPEDLLTLAYEPEAAAMHCKEVTLLTAEGNNRKIETFKNGQRFLVLDCGGS